MQSFVPIVLSIPEHLSFVLRVLVTEQNASSFWFVFDVNMLTVWQSTDIFDIVLVLNVYQLLISAK